ncbi:MAG: hypothetical protein ABMB14_06205 [Myxococcota bacterium]
MPWWWWLGCGPDWFSAAPDPTDPAPCPDVEVAAVGRAVRVHLWLDPAASAPIAAASTAAAARFWAIADVTWVSAGTTRGPVGVVLGGDVTAGDDLEAVIAPLRAWFATRYASGADVDLVLVPEIAGPRSPAVRAAGGDIAGFTVSPALIDAADPALGAAVSEALGRSATPTVFVATDVLAALGPDRARWVVAHELGHALGLVHDPQPGNLMSAAPLACRPGLRADQAARIRGSW